jgi:hypothetical protein
MWKSPRLEIFEEGKADTARHLELNSAEEIKCNILLQSACYLQGVCCYHDQNVQGHSFNVGDMVLRQIWNDNGYTSLTRDGRGLSSCTRLQALGHIAYSILMARRFLIPGISSIYAVLILSQPRCLLSAPGDQYFQDVFCQHLEINTSCITPFYWFTTGITCKFAEGASLPYFR